MGGADSSVSEIDKKSKDNCQRLWISLPSDPKCATELASRLGRGITKDDKVSIEPVLNADGNCRGFGFVTSLEDESQGRQIIDLYHNTKWKGFRLLFEPAKPGYLERIHREVEKSHTMATPAPASLRAYEEPAPMDIKAVIMIRPRRGAELVKVLPGKKRKFGGDLPTGSITDIKWENDNVSIYESRTDGIERRTVEVTMAPFESGHEGREKDGVGKDQSAIKEEMGVEDEEEYVEQEGEEEEECDDEEEKDTEGEDGKEEAEGNPEKMYASNGLHVDTDNGDNEPNNALLGSTEEKKPCEEEAELEPNGDLPVSSGPDVSCPDAMIEVGLREEMSSEAHRSLSILSSLLGSCAPPAAILAVDDAATKQKRPSSFQAVERFWGDELEDDDSELAPSTTVASENEPSNSGAFEAKWGSLKSVFHAAGPAKVPESGFAEEEDPLSLKGLPSMTERETATQAHSFSFDFSDQGYTKERVSGGGEPLKPVAELPRNATDGLCIELWDNSARVEMLVRRELSSPRVRASDVAQQEIRQGLLRGVKRKVRAHFQK